MSVDSQELTPQDPIAENENGGITVASIVMGITGLALSMSYAVQTDSTIELHGKYFDTPGVCLNDSLYDKAWGGEVDPVYNETGDITQFRVRAAAKNVQTLIFDAKHNVFNIASVQPTDATKALLPSDCPD